MKLYNRKQNDPAPLGQADPYMIKAGDGRYYIYATGPSGPQLYSSDTLLEGWEYEGGCLDMTGQKNIICIIQAWMRMMRTNMDRPCGWLFRILPEGNSGW